jgi:hypothetical protein
MCDFPFAVFHTMIREFDTLEAQTSASLIDQKRYRSATMDPGTIAAAALGLLVPYVKKAMEEFAGEAGKSAYAKVAGLFTVLKQRLVGDPAVQDTVARFEQQPERYKPFLEDVLKEKFTQDGALLSEIERLVAEIRESAPDIVVVQKIKRAEHVVGLNAGVMTKGRVTVNQEIEQAGTATGAKIDRIG